MAIIVAVQSGNWSDTSGTSPWPGGVKPGVGDTVQTGDFSIEIDEDIEVAMLEGTENGQFTVYNWVNATITIRANIVVSSATGNGAVGFLSPGSSQLVIYGDIHGGSLNNGIGLSDVASDGTLIVHGDVYGGSAAIFCPGIYSESSVPITIDGKLISGENGVQPIHGRMRLVASPANEVTFLDTTDAQITLSNDYPAVADVRHGTLYNRGTMQGELVAGGTGPVSITINITGAGCS